MSDSCLAINKQSALCAMQQTTLIYIGMGTETRYLIGLGAKL